MDHCDADEFKKGKLTSFKLANTGALGELEDAVNLWVCGGTIEAERHLKTMETLAKSYIGPIPEVLLRGFCIDLEMFADIARDGITITHRFLGTKTFESWSSSPASVINYVGVYGKPWICFVRPTVDLDVIIYLPTFEKEAGPVNMAGRQNEAIVRTPENVHYSPEDIFLSKEMIRKYGLTTFPEDEYSNLPDFLPIRDYFPTSPTCS